MMFCKEDCSEGCLDCDENGCPPSCSQECQDRCENCAMCWGEVMDDKPMPPCVEECGSVDWEMCEKECLMDCLPCLVSDEDCPKKCTKECQEECKECGSCAL